MNRDDDVNAQSWKRLIGTGTGQETGNWTSASLRLSEVLCLKEKSSGSERNPADNWMKAEIDLSVFAAALKDVIYWPFEVTHEESSPERCDPFRFSPEEFYV